MNDIITIQELRDLGYEVRVTHLRRTRWGGDAETTALRERQKHGTAAALLPCGGQTMVAIRSRSMRFTESAVLGRARCHPKDNYCKKTGRELALERALDYVQGLAALPPLQA